MKKSTLLDLGFSQNEAIVYETLLKTGELIPTEIAQKTGLSRVNAYALLKGLVKKGVAEEFEKKKKLHYRLEPPQKLLDWAGERKKSLEDSEKALSSFLPALISDYNLSHNKPGVVYYEGLEGIKKIYEDTLREKPEEILAFLEPQEVDPRLYKWLTEYYVKRRVREKIPAKVIVALDKPSHEYVEKDKEELRKTKTIKKARYPFKIEVDVYGEKVAFINYHQKGRLTGIIIDNKSIAQSMRSIFHLVWDNLK